MNKGESIELKVGDKIRLVGDAWNEYRYYPNEGEIVEVTEVRQDGSVSAGDAGLVLDSGGVLFSDRFNFEVVPDEPEYPERPPVGSLIRTLTDDGFHKAGDVFRVEDVHEYEELDEFWAVPEDYDPDGAAEGDEYFRRAEEGETWEYYEEDPEDTEDLADWEKELLEQGSAIGVEEHDLREFGETVSKFANGGYITRTEENTRDTPFFDYGCIIPVSSVSALGVEMMKALQKHTRVESTNPEIPDRGYLVGKAISHLYEGNLRTAAKYLDLAIEEDERG